MIIVYHRNGKAIEVINLRSKEGIACSGGNVLQQLFDLAKDHPESYLLWCDERLREDVNIGELQNIFEHKNILVSFAPGTSYLPEAIGYVDQSNFINIAKGVSYPTWRMTSAVGGTHASILAFWKGRHDEVNFDYFLNSMAKLSMPFGLRCYSEPRLLLKGRISDTPRASMSIVFKFVKQHYKTRWTALLLLCLLVYEKRFPVLAFIACQFYKKKSISTDTVFADNAVKEALPRDFTIDVVIPTIGRKKYLFATLSDLKAQTLLPDRIIIVEQNPLPGSTSELDFIETGTWPFEVVHIFTHQPGACNARNVALDNVKSDWVFLADDDIRLDHQFLQQTFNTIYSVGSDVFNICCITKNETRQDHHIHQTTLFGSGCSIISRKSLGNTRFSMAFEFGFGEDFDFGAQLANCGFDTHYLPEPIILHMKAPSGGFRTKIKLAWSDDEIKPKPSPTVLLSKMLHFSQEQLNGYKTTLFFKNYKNRESNNPFKYLATFKARWDRSVFWAAQLQQGNADVKPKVANR